MQLIILPISPTLNSYYGCNGRVKYLTKAAKAYREQVIKIVNENEWDYHADVRLRVSIVINFKDKRTNDLDNRLKGLLDACTHAKIWLDDEQIDDLHVRRGVIDGKGTIMMNVGEYTD